MNTAASILALLFSAAAVALSTAVALRVKKLLDPLTEEGALSGRRGEGVSAGTEFPNVSSLVDIGDIDRVLPPAISGPWVISFQAVGCSGCESQLSVFAKFLRRIDLPVDRVFSVIRGDAEGLNLYKKEIGTLSTIIPGTAETALLESTIGIHAFPTYLIVSDGLVQYSTQSSARLMNEAVELIRPAAEAVR